MKGPTSGGARGGSGRDLPDAELRETLDLLGQLVANMSDRLDRQAAALDRLAEAQGQMQAQAAAFPPDHVAPAAAAAIRDALVPHLHKIVDVMQELNGGKALLRERWRAFDREEARQGRWRFQPWSVVLGIPLALVLVLALAVPRAVAQTPLTCRAFGGDWWGATQNYPAACYFWTDRRNEAGSS